MEQRWARRPYSRAKTENGRQGITKKQHDARGCETRRVQKSSGNWKKEKTYKHGIDLIRKYTGELDGRQPMSGVGHRQVSWEER